MARIHAVLPDNRTVVGVEVGKMENPIKTSTNSVLSYCCSRESTFAFIVEKAFRLVYTRLGMGWIYAFTKIPILRKVAQGIYNFWADRRTQVWHGPKIYIPPRKQLNLFGTLLYVYMHYLLVFFPARLSLSQLTKGKTLEQVVEEHEILLKDIETCSIARSQSSASERAAERPARKERPAPAR
mmetsp:Transcript_34576/g.136325  ORF Transcript_34576/g.136325 Transcript_34576/m.136325 type:complete len:183 (-) Transcript_34576:2810-3358(-)